MISHGTRRKFGLMVEKLLAQVRAGGVGVRKAAILRDLPVFVDGSAESVTSDNRDVASFGLGECS
jgi:hypothetical protein